MEGPTPLWGLRNRERTYPLINMIMMNFFPPENRAAHEIMWKNIVERGQATDEDMAHADYMLDN